MTLILFFAIAFVFFFSTNLKTEYTSVLSPLLIPIEQLLDNGPGKTFLVLINVEKYENK